jgi:hypothetical protein
VRPYKDVAAEVRDKFGVFQHILKLLQPVSLFSFVQGQNGQEAEDNMDRIKANYVQGIADRGT